jgi:hypothetical protein
MFHKTLFTELQVDHVSLLLLLNTWQASSERSLFWKDGFGEYEQQGDQSRLTFATLQCIHMFHCEFNSSFIFLGLQERKTDIFNALVKMEQGGNTNSLLQV